jgi:hypothetical protein
MRGEHYSNPSVAAKADFRILPAATPDRSFLASFKRRRRFPFAF